MILEEGLKQISPRNISTSPKINNSSISPRAINSCGNSSSGTSSKSSSPEPESNMFKPAVPPRSPDTRLSRRNLSLFGGSPRSPHDGSAAVRSMSPANLGFGYHNKATTHLSPSFINNTRN